MFTQRIDDRSSLPVEGKMTISRLWGIIIADE